MALDFANLSPEELLAAESAVLTMRSLMDAAKAAPHGHGMVCVETALHENGFEHLRGMPQAAVASYAGAQKKGSAVALFLRQSRRVQALEGKERPERRRAHCRRAAV